MASGYDVAGLRALERIAASLGIIQTDLRRIADYLEAQYQEPPMENPPDTSWMETEDIKNDYGRDPR